MSSLVDQRHRLPAAQVARRVLEDQPGFRITVGGTALGGGALLAATGLGLGWIAAVAMWSFALWTFRVVAPETRARRLAADAKDRVPDHDGSVTLVGTVRACADPIASSFSRRPCVAFWARHTDTYGPSPANFYDAGQYAAATEFVLDCRGTQVMIAAAGADVVFDRDDGEIVDHRGELRPMNAEMRQEPRRQEVILVVGDRVVVSGTLVRDRADAGPYRASGLPSIRLEGRRVRPLVVSLVRPPP